MREILIHFYFNCREIASFWSADVPEKDSLVTISITRIREEESTKEMYRVQRHVWIFEYKEGVGEMSVHVDVYLKRCNEFDLMNCEEPTGYQYVATHEAAKKYFDRIGDAE